MCFSRKSFWREEHWQGERKDPLWELFYRERGRTAAADRHRERDERDAERSREKVPAGVWV